MTDSISTQVIKNLFSKNANGKNKKSSHGINKKVYKGTIHGHNYGATVSRRYGNAPLSNGEIPTRIGNRNYAVTVKGGRKKSYRRKTRRNYSAFLVKKSK
jgi:hypothetical protein